MYFPAYVPAPHYLSFISYKNYPLHYSHFTSVPKELKNTLYHVLKSKIAQRHENTHHTIHNRKLYMTLSHSSARHRFSKIQSPKLYV